MAKRESRPWSLILSAFVGLLACLALGPGAAAQDAPPKKEGLLGPWAATAEVSYVVTGGNSATSALSVGTSFTRKWTKDTMLFKAYILNSRSKTTIRTAQGTEADYDILEETITRKVAENYLLSGQYDRRVSKRLSAQGGASWDRNRFAGVDDRIMVGAGFGYLWIEKAQTIVKTSAGLTYTLRQYVGQDMESFSGFRLSTSADLASSNGREACRPIGRWCSTGSHTKPEPQRREQRSRSSWFRETKTGRSSWDSQLRRLCWGGRRVRV